MLDEYVWGNARRLSPEAPVPVVELRSESFRPGGAGNVAANVVSLGGVAQVVGVVGNDEAAERVMSSLDARGIDRSCVLAQCHRPTTVKTRVMANDRQVVRLDGERLDELSHESSLAVLDACTRVLLDRVDACIVADYAKGLVTPLLLETIFVTAKKRSLPVIVDAKGMNYARYQGATVLKPNQLQVERWLGYELHDQAALLAAGQSLAAELDGTALLITQGAQGMTLFRGGMAPQAFPTQARPIIDVTGAGDTVAGTLGLALVAGTTLEQSIRLANLAAGIAVERIGTAEVTAAELLVALEMAGA